MIAIQKTAEALESMGLEACVQLERSIGREKREDDLEESVGRLVLISDAHAQLELATDERDPEIIGDIWVPSANGFVKRSISSGKVAPELAEITILKPRFREIQILEWVQTRQEVFQRNSGYHGRRYGPDYSGAVASGRLA